MLSLDIDLGEQNLKCLTELLKKDRTSRGKRPSNLTKITDFDL